MTFCIWNYVTVYPVAKASISYAFIADNKYVSVKRILQLNTKMYSPKTLNCAREQTVNISKYFLMIINHHLEMNCPWVTCHIPQSASLRSIFYDANSRKTIQTNYGPQNVLQWIRSLSRLVQNVYRPIRLYIETLVLAATY